MFTAFPAFITAVIREFFHEYFFSPIRYRHVISLSRHSVRLMNERQSVHHSQSKALRCLYNTQNNIWLLVDIQCLFSCSTRSLTHSLHSLVSYRVEHQKRTRIPYPRAPMFCSLRWKFFPKIVDFNDFIFFFYFCLWKKNYLTNFLKLLAAGIT